jgi:hypothetical protein
MDHFMLQVNERKPMSQPAWMSLHQFAFLGIDFRLSMSPFSYGYKSRAPNDQEEFYQFRRALAAELVVSAKIAKVVLLMVLVLLSV